MNFIEFKTKFTTYKCKVSYSKYISNQRISITLVDYDNYPIAVATVNIPEENLDYNEVAIKNWSENEGILKTLINAGIINKPHRQVDVGFVKADICYLNDGLEILKNLLTQNTYIDDKHELFKVQNSI